MKRQLLLTLGLAAVVLLLALAAWLLPERSPPRETVPLTTLKPGMIDSIRISNHRGEFLLERRATGWVMSQPYNVAANEFLIHKLLQITQADSLERFPVPTGRLVEFGLEPPQAVLDLGPVHMEMGGTDPINHRRYLRIGDTLHLIQDRFPHHLLAGAEAFVNLGLVPPRQTLTAIRAPGWRLAKGEDGRLVLDPPDEALSVDDLQRKLQRWQQAQATRAVPLQGDTAAPELELTLEGEASPLRYRIIERDNRVLLLRSDLGLAFRLPGGSDLLLPPTPQEGP